MTKTGERIRSEIVVIGGGGSGLAAAVSALENGAKRIVILEKRAKLGGNAVFPDGILAADSPLQRRLGMDTSVDELFGLAVGYSHWKIDPVLVRALLERSGDTIQWLEEKGIRFADLIPHYPYQTPNTYHAAGGPGTTGSLIVKALSQACERSKAVRIERDTSAESLVLEKGRTAGVLARTKEGRTVRIDAKGVIICTGGFSGNEALIKEYDPGYNKDEVPPLGIPHQGDGIRMAREVGAALDGMVVFDWEEHFPPSAELTVIARRPVTVWVNRKGRRFIDEGVPILVEVANAIYRQPGKVVYCLFDQKIKERLLSREVSPFERLFLGARFDTGIQESFRRKVEKELIRCAAEETVKISDRWDEIARWMGAGTETLKSTVDEYNSYCDKGYDERLAKNPAILHSLRNPPYFALKCGIRLTVTHGGIKINHRMEALGTNDEPIPGLYAAGVETGTTDWDTYNMRLSGHSFSYTVNGGRIAGEEAARYVEAYEE
jgi:fumarate reductase flavoprotein subunit